MDGPEDPGDQLPRAWVLFQGDEVPVDLVEILMALHEKFANDLTKVFHGLPPARGFLFPHRLPGPPPEDTVPGALRRIQLSPPGRRYR
ncbi:hypothetical protein KRM28CT15_65200 [Krasilnikovia sp. M28-CT-15]